ncbi:MAG: hypothetical protein Q9N26_06015 [Aquificota bacterium]|nr:hypothetical protein [Aquificota bacterium]
MQDIRPVQRKVRTLKALRGVLREREETRVDLLILTSDRGYVGGFVEAVLKETVSFIEKFAG